MSPSALSPAPSAPPDTAGPCMHYDIPITIPFKNPLYAKIFYFNGNANENQIKSPQQTGATVGPHGDGPGVRQVPPWATATPGPPWLGPTCPALGPNEAPRPLPGRHPRPE